MLTPAFSCAQSAIAPAEILLTDVSTGSDINIVYRRVYVQTSAGVYLVQSGTTTDYNPWSYADATVLLNLLSTDQACAITVQWLDITNTVLYTLTQEFCFPQYNKQFFYYLIQMQALKPSILQDQNYFASISKYWALIIGAVNAVEIGADIAASQNCLNMATDMKNNQNIYFN